jgi:YVTN family beta-propeller protein
MQRRGSIVIENAVARVSIMLAKMSVPALALSLLCAPAGGESLAYVTNRNSNTVSVIDTATAIVKATVAVEGSPIRVAVAPDGRRAYVTITNPRGPGMTWGVSVIDTTTNVVINTIGFSRHSHSSPTKNGQPATMQTPQGFDATHGGELFPIDERTRTPTRMGLGLAG